MIDQQNGQTQEPQKPRFNPNDHLMQLKSKEGPKDYLPVQWRLVWFREECPQGTIDVDELEVDLDREVEEEAYVWNAEKRRSEKVIKRAKGYARYKAIVTDGKGGRSTGTKSENAASFPDYIEKAETGAIGRALAGLGYGTQFAPDLNEGPRLADSPVNTTSTTRPATTAASTSSTEEKGEALITDQQQASAIKLYGFLQREIPDDLAKMTYLNAKKLIQQLTSDYQQYRARQGKPVQPEPVVRMINAAKQRCESLGLIWEDAKTDAQITTPDDQLIVDEVVKINKTLDQYTENKKVKTKAS